MTTLKGKLSVLIVAAAALAGCAEGRSGESASAKTPATVAQGDSAAAKAKRVTRVALRESDYGKVLFASKGRALYLFTADSKGKSNCSGECASAWPPFLARGRLEAGPGVKRRLLGATTRPDGRRQVSYAGHPLYFYVHDPPNEILCHDVTEFGGDWLVVRASGKPAP